MPIEIRRLTASMHSADVLFIVYALLLSIVNLVFSSRILYWKELVLINLAGIGFIFLLGYARHRTNAKLIHYVHDWYVPLVVFFSFKELYYMIKPIHGGRDYDDLLIAVDQWLFGVNPTEWLVQFSHPLLTETLQIAYTSFYLLFLIIGYELYRKHDLNVFHFYMFTCVYGFFLSYMGYFTLPAVGPRFTLHDFSALDTDLPGLLLTPYLRWFVNAGGSVPMGVPNDVAIAGTQRDVFPSGHTMMTLVLMWISAKYNLQVRYVMYVVGSLLIVSTVYQRYHYVIDLVAGAVFMAICVSTSRHLYEFIKRRFETLESRLV